MLFNISQFNQNEALCSQFGGWTRDEITGEDVYVAHRFGVGHGAESFTTKTSWMVGHYLGDPANPCITVIDTLGTGNTEGIALAEGIKRIGSITAFMMLFNGEIPRFTQSTQERVKLYENIFGREMWKNIITEFTFWGHDEGSIKKRWKNRMLNETIQHRTWNEEYRSRFGVTQTIPTVFVDPVFDEEYADSEETAINNENTDKLWSLLTQNLTTFGCNKACKAPSGFFAGQPRLLEENHFQNKRLQDHTAFTWQIWFAGCDETGTKSYTISHVNSDNITKVIYEHHVNEDHTEWKDVSKLKRSMAVVDKPIEKLLTISLTIESTEEDDFGSYFVENDKGRSVLGELKEIVDGEWQGWSHFGPCSKTCISGFERPGLMQRQRMCKPPQNGGQPCKGDSKEEKPCAHHQSDERGTFR